MTQLKNDEIYINIDDIDFTDLDLDTTFTISTDNTDTLSTSNIWSWDSTNSTTITLNEDTTYRYPKYRNELDEKQIESMCKQYPALEKVWRNFKSVYDLVQQDYKGKQKVGEIEDDNPF
jgi:hypothetical protein